MTEVPYLELDDAGTVVGRILEDDTTDDLIIQEPQSGDELRIGSGRTELSGGLRLPTGNAIEDGGGNDRIGITAGGTELYFTNGQFALQVLDGTAIRANAHSAEPFTVFDREGSFTALEYSTAPSTGDGTLAIDADVTVSNGKLSLPPIGLNIGDAPQFGIRYHTFDSVTGNYLFTFSSGNHDPFILRHNFTNTLIADNGNVEIPNGGPASAGGIDFSNGRIYENASGEIVAEDSAGNTTVLT